MVIPESLEQAVGSAVAHHLGVELSERGLLLAPDRQAAAAADGVRRGKRLLTRVVHQCYPIAQHAGEDVVVEYDSEAAAERVTGALAFGAATAAVLASAERDGEPPGDSVELLCAVFTLGVGLVDGLCDGDAGTGVRVLGLVQEGNLADAAKVRPLRGWLRGDLPTGLSQDPTVAFTIDVVEAFFETLHAVYPGDAWLPLRGDVGRQLDAALDAERRSVHWSVEHFPRERLIECSRLTSVLPFEIVHTLSRGAHPTTEPAAGTLLGEAMWRIDDLVDLCQDARSGALNSVLLAHSEAGGADDGDPGPVPALERLLASPDIAREAARAAESLSAGLRSVRGDPTTADRRVAAERFLSFIQRYAGIPSGPRS